MSPEAQKRVGAAMAWMLLPFMIAGILYMAGWIIEIREQRSIDYHACLKGATNGLDIERCKDDA
jgi:hypothetical protein